MTLINSQVVVVGGSSGLGLAAAKAAARLGANVHIVGRDGKKLDTALAELGPTHRGSVLDIADARAAEGFFAGLTRVDHLVVTAATNAAGLVATAPIDNLRQSMESRFWGAIHAIRGALPRMPVDGSITLTSGMATHRPPPEQSIATASAAALEALARALALELTPIRINVINPGPIRTPLLERVVGNDVQAVAALAQRLPLKRIGDPADFGHAAVFAMTNSYLNGTTLHLDGAAPWA
jgi:NAD(P)-dependent dehydrogenase (short-subunit alcohol dehydrogenase family)